MSYLFCIFFENRKILNGLYKFDFNINHLIINRSDRVDLFINNWVKKSQPKSIYLRITSSRISKLGQLFAKPSY